MNTVQKSQYRENRGDRNESKDDEDERERERDGRIERDRKSGLK